MESKSYKDELRTKLVEISLEWERKYAIVPSITSALSERDAALIMGHDLAELRSPTDTAVKKGVDFEVNGIKFQVKANRPSGKKGSKVTLVSKPKNYDWDYLIWILYDEKYDIQEAWKVSAEEAKQSLDSKSQVRPNDIRQIGTKIW